MLKTISSLLIIIGFTILIFYLGEESSKKDKNLIKNNLSKEKSLEQNFDRMFKDSSVWNSYDISKVKKIYRTQDLNNISVSL